MEDFQEFGLVCRRTIDSGTSFNVPHKVKRHSPTGMEWGYCGSGPADLALNTLLLVTDEETALELYQDFKFDFISKLPLEGGRVPIEKILDWIQKRREAQG